VYGKPQVKECPSPLNFAHHKAWQASGEAMAPTFRLIKMALTSKFFVEINSENFSFLKFNFQRQKKTL
jgi:hypothetical protein